MPAMVDLYSQGDSWLHRMDPRVKLVLAACSVSLLLMLRHPAWMLAGLILLLGLHAWAGIPRRRLVALFRAVLPVSLLMALLRLVFHPAGAVWMQVGPIAITQAGLEQSLALGLRIPGMALGVFLWLYTTESEMVLLSLQRLGMPYPWAMAVSLALRYIPMLQRSYSDISLAQQARGLDLSGLRGVRRIRAQFPIFIAMIIGALRDSERLSQALEARGFGRPRASRSSYRQLSLRFADWIFLAAILAITAGMILSRIWDRLGS